MCASPLASRPLGHRRLKWALRHSIIQRLSLLLWQRRRQRWRDSGCAGATVGQQSKCFQRAVARARHPAQRLQDGSFVGVRIR
eukprot:1812981-Pyramimonas_sp.AAC.1